MCTKCYCSSRSMNWAIPGVTLRSPESLPNPAFHVFIIVAEGYVSVEGKKLWRFQGRKGKNLSVSALKISVSKIQELANPREVGTWRYRARNFRVWQAFSQNLKKTKIHNVVTSGI